MKIIKEIEVRFRDIDSMGHVNNAVYLNYFEQARIKFFNELIGEKWDWLNNGVIIARQEIDYKVPVLLNDNVKIYTWCEHVGNSSLIFKYELKVERNGKPIICTEGKTILVCYSVKEETVIKVPEDWKKKIQVISGE